MHNQARCYVARWKTDDPLRIIEIGSRDVNGTVRDLFPAAEYVGLDLAEGPSVDVVCHAGEFVPDWPADIVICCEVLEHAVDWCELVAVGASWLRPGGRLIVTAAGAGREPHSAVDGCELRDGEYYGNIRLRDLILVMEGSGVSVCCDEFSAEHCDVRASGLKV